MGCPFSKYKNMLGEVNKGVHKYNIPGTKTALVDYILSLGLAWVITASTNIPLVLTTISVLLLGILSHILFGVKTSTITYLGLCK